MKTLKIVAAVILLPPAALILCAVAVGLIRGAYRATHKPRFDWREVKTETVSLSAGDVYRVHFPRPVPGKLHVTADSAVNVSAGDCSGASVIDREARCELSEISIADTRGTGTLADAVLGIAMHDASAIERTAKPNRVRVVFSVWDCIENCS